MLTDSHGAFGICRFMPQSMPKATMPSSMKAAQIPADPQHTSTTCGSPDGSPLVFVNDVRRGRSFATGRGTAASVLGLA
eukprot:2061945-Lingulodinium_polyedra.AAC.1